MFIPYHKNKFWVLAYIVSNVYSIQLPIKQ